MDKPEDVKPPADEAATGSSNATPAAPAGAPAEPSGEIARIEAPSIVPSVSEPTGLEAPAKASPKSSAKPDETASARPKNKVPATIDLVPASSSTSSARARARRSFGIAPLAAAAVVGLVAGALGATIAPPLGALIAGTPAPAAPAVEQPAATAVIMAQTRADIAALKTSTEAASRSTNAQLAKLSDRFDRLERAQAAAKAAEATAAAAKETTGTVSNAATSPLPPPPVTAAPLPQAAIGQSSIVQGWVLRDVYRGNAILQSRMGGMIEVGPGDILPGAGRVETIRRQDGHWVVITTKGMIVSMR